jgi:hypothetical protein
LNFRSFACDREVAEHRDDILALWWGDVDLQDCERGMNSQCKNASRVTIIRTGIHSITPLTVNKIASAKKGGCSDPEIFLKKMTKKIWSCSKCFRFVGFNNSAILVCIPIDSTGRSSRFLFTRNTVSTGFVCPCAIIFFDCQRNSRQINSYIPECYNRLYGDQLMNVLWCFVSFVCLSRALEILSPDTIAGHYPSTHCNQYISKNKTTGFESTLVAWPFGFDCVGQGNASNYGSRIAFAFDDTSGWNFEKTAKACKCAHVSRSRIFTRLPPNNHASVCFFVFGTQAVGAAGFLILFTLPTSQSQFYLVSLDHHFEPCPLPVLAGRRSEYLNVIHAVHTNQTVQVWYHSDNNPWREFKLEFFFFCCCCCCCCCCSIRILGIKGFHEITFFFFCSAIVQQCPLHLPAACVTSCIQCHHYRLCCQGHLLSFPEPSSRKRKHSKHASESIFFIQSPEFR